MGNPGLSCGVLGTGSSQQPSPRTCLVDVAVQSLLGCRRTQHGPELSGIYTPQLKRGFTAKGRLCWKAWRGDLPTGPRVHGAHLRLGWDPECPRSSRCSSRWRALAESPVPPLITREGTTPTREAFQAHCQGLREEKGVAGARAEHQQVGGPGCRPVKGRRGREERKAEELLARVGVIRAPMQAGSPVDSHSAGLD